MLIINVLNRTFEEIRQIQNIILQTWNSFFGLDGKHFIYFIDIPVLNIIT